MCDPPINFLLHAVDVLCMCMCIAYRLVLRVLLL
jgi:hypothetical protein